MNYILHSFRFKNAMIVMNICHRNTIVAGLLHYLINLLKSSKKSLFAYPNEAHLDQVEFPQSSYFFFVAPSFHAYLICRVNCSFLKKERACSLWI